MDDWTAVRNAVTSVAWDMIRKILPRPSCYQKKADAVVLPEES